MQLVEEFSSAHMEEVVWWYLRYPKNLVPQHFSRILELLMSEDTVIPTREHPQGVARVFSLR